MSMKKAMQLTAVIVALAVDRYLANAAPKFAQVSSNIWDYEDEFSGDDCEEDGFNSAFLNILSPLNRMIVPATLMDTSEFCDDGAENDADDDADDDGEEQ